MIWNDATAAKRRQCRCGTVWQLFPLWGDYLLCGPCRIACYPKRKERKKRT